MIRSSNTARLLRFQGETNFLPSKTIPDQSMTVQEIMRRYASGQSLTGGRTTFYDEVDPLPQLEKMDLVDIQEAKQENAERIRRNGERLAKWEDDKKNPKANAAGKNNGDQKRIDSGTDQSGSDRKPSADSESLKKDEKKH